MESSDGYTRGWKMYVTYRSNNRDGKYVYSVRVEGPDGTITQPIKIAKDLSISQDSRVLGAFLLPENRGQPRNGLEISATMIGGDPRRVPYYFSRAASALMAKIPMVFRPSLELRNGYSAYVLNVDEVIEEHSGFT